MACSEGESQFDFSKKQTQDGVSSVKDNVKKMPKDGSSLPSRQGGGGSSEEFDLCAH